MHERRTQRVSEAVREELAEIISFEMCDWRLGVVDVTEVQVGPDLRHAHVRVSLGGHADEQQQAMAALDHARHYLRRELARRLNLRRAPELHFQLDPGANIDPRIHLLLKRAKKIAERSKINRSMKQAMVALFLLAAPAIPAEMLRLEQSAESMGSAYSVIIYGKDRARMESAAEDAFEEVRRVDRMLSNYRPESELSAVNRSAAERPVKVSDALFRLLEACINYSRESEGAFDITVGPLMKVWGFYRGDGRLPQRPEIREVMERVGYQHIELDAARHTIHFAKAGVELDPGGIGKGYAVDRMVDILRKDGIETALVSAAGSSIYGMGGPPGEKGWKVSIRDPKDDSKTVAQAFLKNESMSTSGNYEKFFRAEGRIYSHIMDPRTGYPAQGMLSVSIIAPLTLDSEAWTKPNFINGREWTLKHKPKGFRVFLCEDKSGQPCEWLQ